MDFGPGEEEGELELLRWLRSRDISVNGTDADGEEAICRLEEVVPKPRRIPKSNPIFRVWNRWLELRSECYPDSARVYSITGEEMRLIGDLVRAYGEGTVLKIIEVALKDWAAMRMKHGHRLPEIPTIREVYKHRAELADASARGGITVAGARVSQYAKDRDASLWERKE